ncbi:hypothetical protein V6N12_003116 [Hibiscus sabdariffa]|uniref:Uncharacterized protein n=1 Tax=Hibiscus sabdariffa TaxID=183260 RepID=A0ABR2ECP4_9ROSI
MPAVEERQTQEHNSETDRSGLNDDAQVTRTRRPVTGTRRERGVMGAAKPPRLAADFVGRLRQMIAMQAR